jgi:D-tyrosyl-tRNA(Tyr) deacylase
MRALIQRVKKASVDVGPETVASISAGLLVFLGIEDADNEEDVAWLCQKIVQLRIFPDEEGVMNRSLLELNGELLLVSQFTLHAATKKGNRPSYIRASKPEKAIPMYQAVHRSLSDLLQKEIPTGIFGADMQVSLMNDGPVTIWIDTKQKE